MALLEGVKAHKSKQKQKKSKGFKRKSEDIAKCEVSFLMYLFSLTFVFLQKNPVQKFILGFCISFVSHKQLFALKKSLP